MSSKTIKRNPDKDKIRQQRLHDQSSPTVKPSRRDIQEVKGLCAAGKMADAEFRIKQLLGKHPDSAVLYSMLGHALYSQGKIEEAIANYQQALKLEPNDAETHIILGKIFMRIGSLEQALASLRQALNIDPRNIFAHGILGITLSQLGKDNEALASFEQAVRIDPGNAGAHGNLGNGLAKLGKVEEAVISYQQALKIKPDVARVHNNLGNALMLLGRLDEAKASYYQSLKLNPNDETYFNLHPLLFDPHNMSPAIQCLESALKLQPANNTYKFFLGMLLDYSGRVVSADAYFKDVQQGSNFDKARLDAWNYIKSVGMPRMVGSSIEALQLGIAAAPSSGLVLEFGVRFGVSIRQIAGLVEHGQQVHGFDSFEGLPEAWHHEAKGAYSTNEAMPEVPDNVRLYKGWFENTLPEFVKTHKEPVRFVNIDCDLYSSTKTVLDCLSSQVIPGTVIVFDEYVGNEYWREDEFKAFQEAVGAYGWKYEYLAFSMLTKQVVVRIV